MNEGLDVPIALLLVDQDRRVSVLNDAAERLAPGAKGESPGMRPGGALGCLHALDDPSGCGFGPHCQTCPLRRAVLETFARRKGCEPVEAVVRVADGTDRCLLISTAYLESEGSGKVIVGAQDITGRKRTEDALRASEERYRALFENMLDGFAYCQMLYDERGAGIDFVYLAVNDRFSQLTGLRNVVGKRVTDLIPGIRQLAPALFDIYGRVAATGTAESFEIDFKPLSRWLSVSAYGAQKGYFVAVFDDISERKLNEIDRETMLAVLRLANAGGDTRELIREVTAELRAWSGCEAVGIRLRDGDDFPYFETRGFPGRFVEAENYLCARDAAGVPLRANDGDPVLECMCGNVLCGRCDPRQPFFTAGGSFWTNSTTNLLASTTETDRQGLTRNRCNGEGYESVALIPLRCGQRTLGLLQFNDRRPERFTLAKIALMERAAGSLAMALDQRAMQEALRESESRFRLLVESSPDAIMVETEGRIAYLNRAGVRLLGADSTGQLLGTPVADRFPPDLREFGRQRIRTVNEERTEVPTFEWHYLRLDGTMVAVESSAVPIHYQGSDGALVFIRDITERNRAAAEREKLREQLAQAQTMESIGRLAGGVAHDFNNLLTVINGYSKMLLRSPCPDPRLQDGLEEICKAGERAAALTQQLLAFSRKQLLQPRVLDLNRVLSGMRPMMARLLGEDVELRFALHPEAATIDADPHQLEQVVMNLAVNARDAMPQGGTLALATSVVECGETALRTPPGRYVLLAVSDSGIGMDDETLRRIFEPFFTTKAIGKGTGLGLPMILGIVEQSGGRIEVDSLPGRGTTFRVYLPHAQAQVAAEAPPDSPAARGDDETVLVVEDQVEVRKFVAAALTEYGYHAIQAESAAEAIAHCERESGGIRLVLTDVVMPNMGGKQLAERIAHRWPGIKVLLMSGFADDDEIGTGALDSGVPFLQKPFTAGALARKVREVLASGPAPARNHRVDE